ncbi:MAG TPA: DMT family transporter [Anaerolineales bacterium]|nr:DMT family transporter [Anaerolineales bacterium]
MAVEAQRQPVSETKKAVAAVRRYAPEAIFAALSSAVLLGLAPIFGKQALREGMDIFALVVLRTGSAAIILWIVFAFRARQYLYIYPAGFIACATAGFINGVGSLMYYSGLARLDASLAQLLYTVNPLILAFMLRLDGQPISRLTLVRMIIAFPAVAYLITRGSEHSGQTIGMVLMLGGAFMYALHLAVTQRTLRDMPSQTVTLYTLTAMAITVLPSALAIRTPLTHTPSLAFFGAVGLTIVTVFSRLLLFVSVKRLGGLQAALLGLSELLVSVVAAFIFFGDKLTTTQWVGAIALMISVALVSREHDLRAHHISEGWLAWVYGVFERIRWPEREG